MEHYKVAENKKVRVIIDTDAACEADDQFAVAHALMTQKFIIKGIISEHFKAENSEQLSYDEIKKILTLMNRSDVPVYHGAENPIDDISAPPCSEGIDFIINEAMTESEYPLFIFCQGAVTNVAAALLKKPEIAERMTVIAIIGGDYPDGGGEFNLHNDYLAANVLFASGAELWQVPIGCYSRMRISYAELQEKVRPCGELGKYLFEQMQDYGNSEKAGWTMGESWALGDSPAVGLGMDFCIGKFEYRNSPIADINCNYTGFNENKIRVYSDIDSRFILEDMFAKLKIFFM
ncbi:MAG: nucleoside hydrolase [Oscillospiraceae bacterium]|nr:nucleoside hydrolase [Oscillospiraceae bacterium]